VVVGSIVSGLVFSNLLYGCGVRSSANSDSVSSELNTGSQPALDVPDEDPRVATRQKEDEGRLVTLPTEPFGGPDTHSSCGGPRYLKTIPVVSFPYTPSTALYHHE